MKLTQRQRRWFLRKYRRPRKTTKEIRDEIRRKYFARECKQLQLALDYRLSQGHISRIITSDD